jgi:tripartite-type tricarboxylate transporter receptor subunit TctC
MRKPESLIGVLPVVFFFFLVTTSVATASDFPNKPIQIVVPAPPGGTTDIAARILGPKLSSILGQPVIIVNKPGGGGAVASKIIASATEPDGYTIFTHWTGMVLVPILKPNIGYKLDDFTALAQPVSTLYMIAVKGDSPWKTLDDLIKEARKNPGKLTYSSGGVGSGYHFTGEHFKMETGTDIVHVPMEGDAAAVTALLGGHVDMTVSGLGSMSGYLKAGTVRALANLYHEKAKDFPNIPTIKELGYPRLTTSGWFGYFVPVKTPKEIVEKLGKAFEVATKDKDVIEKIEKSGMVPRTLVLGEATKFFEGEDKRWRDVAKKAKMIEETGK